MIHQVVFVRRDRPLGHDPRRVPLHHAIDHPEKHGRRYPPSPRRARRLPTIRDQAVCLRRRDWSETSQTVTLLTRRHGALRALAKGSRRDRSAFSGGLEPLTLGEAFAITKPNRDLATLTAWDLLDPAPGFRGSLPRFRAGCVAADLAAALITDADPHPEAFDAVARFVAELGRPPRPDAAIGRPARGRPAPAAEADLVQAPLLRVLAALIRSAGQSPDLGDPNEPPPAEPAAFDPAAGVIAPAPARDAPAPAAADPFGERPTEGLWLVRPGTLAALRAALNEPDPAAEPEPTAKPALGPASSPADLRRANRFLAAWIATRLGRPPRSTPELLRLTEP